MTSVSVGVFGALVAVAIAGLSFDVYAQIGLVALIALAATTKGRMARMSYALRLSGAALLGATLRLVGYAAQGLVAHSPELFPLLYVLPLSAAVLAAVALAEVHIIPESVRRLFRGAVGEPA